jgi:hypothetical protein
VKNPIPVPARPDLPGQQMIERQQQDVHQRFQQPHLQGSESYDPFLDPNQVREHDHDDPELFQDLEQFDSEQASPRSSTIFAVNSDVYFLYMIGKMCAETGHNLHQGLQALNDYFLFVWHHSISHSSMQSSDSTSLLNRNPLNSNFATNTGRHRIKECVKTLLCIG